MNRKISYWTLRDSEIQVGVRTLMMGVLNVTPDSFSDGGLFSDPDRAYARALELEEQGADIIDIGAESTRPGSQRISVDEEWRRLVPVLKRLRGQVRAPLSVDTWKSEIAERALDYGVQIINDPSGLTFDPTLARVAANGNAGLVLNHMRGQPDTWAKLPPMPDPAGTIARELEATVSRARHAGVDRARIVIDPGIGFGKRGDQNAIVLAQLRRLAALEYPILVGASRKSFLAQSTDLDTEFATAAAVTAAILNGAHIVRVHDVKRMLAVVRIADEIAHAAAVEPHTAAAEERSRAVFRPAKAAPREPERPGPPRPPIAKAAPPAASAPEELAAAEASPEPAGAPPSPQARRRMQKNEKSAAQIRSRSDADRGGFTPPKRRAFDASPSEGKPRGRQFDQRERRDSKSRFEPRREHDGRGERRFEQNRERPERGERRSDQNREYPARREGRFEPGPKRPNRGERRFEPRQRSDHNPPRSDRPRGDGRAPGPERSGFDRKGPPRRPFRKRP